MTSLDVMQESASPNWTLEGFRPFIENNGKEKWRSVISQQAQVYFTWPQAERVELRLKYHPGVIPQVVTIQLNGIKLQNISTTLLVSGGFYQKVGLHEGKNVLSLISKYRNQDSLDPVIIKLNELKVNTVFYEKNLQSLSMIQVIQTIGLFVMLCWMTAYLLGFTRKP